MLTFRSVAVARTMHPRLDLEASNRFWEEKAPPEIKLRIHTKRFHRAFREYNKVLAAARALSFDHHDASSKS